MEQAAGASKGEFEARSAELHNCQPRHSAARRATNQCLQQVTLWARNHRKVGLTASGVVLLLVMGAFRRARGQGRGPSNKSLSERPRRLGPCRGASADRQLEPCAALWQQIQQRDWLFGLPPQIADAILALLDPPDLKALRATCRQTYLQVAARTTRLVMALDASPRTWRLASPRLDSIYPALRELHLVMAGEAEGEVGAGDASGGSDSAAGPGPSSAALAAAASLPCSRARGGGWPTPRSAAASQRGRGARQPAGGPQSQLLTGTASSGSSGAVWRPPCEPACLREFVRWSACGHLRSLTLLDLSRCEQVAIGTDTWAALVGALGEGEVTMRVPWRCLLQHGAAAGAAGPGGAGRGAAGAGPGSGCPAKVAAASAGGALTSPLPPGPSGSDGAAAGAASFSPPLPAAPPPRSCTCGICGPSPPDASSVVSALQVLAALRPQCSVELQGRGLPMRGPAVLQQLCAVSQLAGVSLALCGVRPLAHHAGWFSCLRRLHSLELRYREEPGGEAALQQLLRALQPPVPLRSLCLHRSGPPGSGSGGLLGEADLAALAALPGLQALDAPGLRVHSPSRLALPGLTRLALRSERLELAQPLVALFPGLQQLELGTGAG
ncbi:hypothetical protein Agub_g4736, partial [Astrephomene gubernaculifera]